MNALPANLSPEPSDSEDVASALETADIFWTKGDTDEAIRWLKRASDSAMDAGNDMRGIAIMRSVADLKSAPTRVAETPPPAPKMSRPPPPSASRAPGPPSATQGAESRRGPPPLPSASGGDGPGRTHASAAPQRGALPQPSPKTRDSAAPPPAPSPRHHSTAPPPAPAAAAATPHKRSSSTDRMAALTPEPTRTTTASAQVSRAAAAAAEPATPAARRSVPASASLPKEPHRPVTPATAYRAVSVFVKPQGRNGEKLEVILAKPGQAVPAGTEPALLVPMRRGGRLVS